MSAYQRRRGAGFEREISGYLSERLGRVVKRKLGQARDSGDDIQVGRFRIECKRRASIAANTGWPSSVTTRNGWRKWTSASPRPPASASRSAPT